MFGRTAKKAEQLLGSVWDEHTRTRTWDEHTHARTYTSALATTQARAAAGELTAADRRAIAASERAKARMAGNRRKATKATDAAPDPTAEVPKSAGAAARRGPKSKAAAAAAAGGTADALGAPKRRGRPPKAAAPTASAQPAPAAKRTRSPRARAYGLFQKHAFAEVRAGAPGAALGETMAEVARRWREMEDADRAEWLQRAVDEE